MKKMRKYLLVMLLLLYLTVGATCSTSSDRRNSHKRVADVKFADSVATYLQRNLDGEYVLIKDAFLPVTYILREIALDRSVFISLELTVTPPRQPASKSNPEGLPLSHNYGWPANPWAARPKR